MKNITHVLMLMRLLLPSLCFKLLQTTINMKYISQEIKKINKKFFSGVSIRILNRKLKQLRSITKSRNIGAYNIVAKYQLKKLIATGKLLPSRKPAS